MSLPGATIRSVLDVRKCLNCEADLSNSGKRGRPSSWCSPACRNRTLYLRRKERGDGPGWRPCTACSKPMQVTPTMAAVPTCLSCRRARSAERAAKPKPVGPWLKVCTYTECRQTYLAEKMSRRFCSTDCFLSDHRAQERIRDAERRKRRREEVPVPALLWRGDEEANALIVGPPREVTDVLLRIDPPQTCGRANGIYIVRCPLCGWLTDHLAYFEAGPVWGCFHCYTKIVLVEVPAQEPDPYRRVDDDAERTGQPGVAETSR
jgi:hypothetical protein